MRTIFITGTDTGVGKTLLTALLLVHLRRAGHRALALKPFCSGSRADAELLHALQDGELTLNEVNPFYFPEPVAPLVSARKHHRRITIEDALSHIHSIGVRSTNPPIHQSTNPSLRHSITPSLRPPVLLIEGSGGLLVPLGEGYTVLHLISELARRAVPAAKTHYSKPKLRLEVIVVSRNKLGTINHTLLTAGMLQNTARSPSRFMVHGSRFTQFRLKIALMNSSVPDASCATNGRVLAELLAPIPLISMPFLGPCGSGPAAMLELVPEVRPQLAKLLA